MQFVEAFDTDNDGVVSKVEWQKGMKMMNLRYHDALEVNIDKLTSRCVRLALARARLLAAMAADGLRGLPQADVRGRENYVWDGCLQLLCVHRPLHRCAQLTGKLSSRSVAWLCSCSCQALTARVCAQFDTTNSYAVTKVRSASPTAAPVHSSATARAD